MEERVMERFTDSPLTCTRAVATEIGVHHSSVWSFLHTERMHPFYIQRVQLLTEDDYLGRVQFVWWMVDFTTYTNFKFPSPVLISDESSFTREGTFNTHYWHMWSMKNPHASIPLKTQQRFSVNVWAETLSDYVLGHSFCPKSWMA